jgi:hypothetical protein
MRISNELGILILFILFTLHTCDFTVHAHDLHVRDFKAQTPVTWVSGDHDLHVRDFKAQTPVTWVSGDTFKDADGKCWHVYKAAEPMSLSNQQLHIEEVTCK